MSVLSEHERRVHEYEAQQARRVAFQQRLAAKLQGSPAAQAQLEDDWAAVRIVLDQRRDAWNDATDDD